MRMIRLRSVEIRPAQKTARPISFPRLMVLAKLIVVDRFIRFIQRIRALDTSVIRESRCYRNARSSEQQRLSILPHALCRRREFGRKVRLRDRRLRQRGCQEL
jgi:hypothetical protein